MLVHEFLERSAERYPDKTALVCANRRLTYSQVEAQANRLANALRRAGMSRGDRAAIFLPNGVEAVLSIFAVMKAGGVFVCLNPTTRLSKMSYILNNCQASFLITSSQLCDFTAALAGEVSSMKWIIDASLTALNKPADKTIPWDDFVLECTDERPANANIDLDLACLVYTSGSTGEPKGVMSDHSNVDFATGSIIAYLQNTPDDIVIDFLPLAFDYGLYQLLMVFKFGGTLVLEQNFAYPADILKKVEQERVTGFPGVPTSYALLLQMDLRPYDLSSLRYMTNTAAALPASHVQALRDKFSWVTIYSMYGLTETKRTLYLPPAELDRHPGSVGKAIPGTEVWLEDENGRRLGPGETGELVVRGRHVMRGYWNDPEASARRYRPGPLPAERVCFTGDLFRMDEDGFFYFVARKDDIIKTRGEKVSPVELERTLYGLKGVLEVAVIGVPDDVLGQAIKAFIVPSDSSLKVADVLAYCRQHVEIFMVPKYVEFLPSLPKTDSGKIKKTGLC